MSKQFWDALEHNIFIQVSVHINLDCYLIW